MSELEELEARREALRNLPAPPPDAAPPQGAAPAPSPPAPPEPEDVKARTALRRFLAAIPPTRELSAEEVRQAEALALAWVQAVRARDKVARRKERRLAAGREWPED